MNLIIHKYSVFKDHLSYTCKLSSVSMALLPMEQGSTVTVVLWPPAAVSVYEFLSPVQTLKLMLSSEQPSTLALTGKMIFPIDGRLDSSM